MIPSGENPESKYEILGHEVMFRYPEGVEALRGVDLHIRSGDYMAIVGGNGSGKTTLAKTLNGLLRPTQGSILVAGLDISRMSVPEIARHVGYAFQNPDHQLFCGTVEEEVSFGPRNLGFPEERRVRSAEHAIAIMGLKDVRDKAPLSLTLSLRRRVSIASVIAMDPEILILDEPTTGLDAREVDRLMENIGALNNEGHTVILITHDMRLVAEHAKRVLVMKAGTVVLDANPKGVFSNPELLSESSLEPPPITLLAKRLSRFGVGSGAVFPAELAEAIISARGVR